MQKLVQLQRVLSLKRAALGPFIGHMQRLFAQGLAFIGQRHDQAALVQRGALAGNKTLLLQLLEQRRQRAMTQNLYHMCGSLSSGAQLKNRANALE